MSFSRPFAAVHTEDQWRRAAHQGTSLQPGTWAVQLAWSHGQPAPDQLPDAPPPTAAGLAFDPWCRLYHSLPDAGRVERILPSGTASSPVPSFRPEDAADLDAGAPPVLHSATLGALSAAPIFHSFATLNPGDAIQVLSGTAPGGHDLLIGFEDLPIPTGDNDFQDVVIGIQASNPGLLLV